MAVVEWLVGRWKFVRFILTVNPNVTSNEPSKEKQVQDTIDKFTGHGAIFVHVKVIFMTTCSLAQDYYCL